MNLSNIYEQKALNLLEAGMATHSLVLAVLALKHAIDRGAQDAPPLMDEEYD